MARNAQITVERDEDVLVIEFAHGKRIELRPATLGPDIRETAMFHGLKQKLVDAAAISRDPETGRSATVEDKYRAMVAVYDRLLSGQWNATRGEGSSTGSGGLLFAALMRLYPAKGADALREYIGGLTPAQQAALRKNPRVAPVIEEIKAERAANDDGEDPGADLLAGLDDL